MPSVGNPEAFNPNYITGPRVLSGMASPNYCDYCKMRYQGGSHMKCPVCQRQLTKR